MSYEKLYMIPQDEYELLKAKCDLRQKKILEELNDESSQRDDAEHLEKINEQKQKPSREKGSPTDSSVNRWSSQNVKKTGKGSRKEKAWKAQTKQRQKNSKVTTQREKTIKESPSSKVLEKFILSLQELFDSKNVM